MSLLEIIDAGVLDSAKERSFLDAAISRMGPGVDPALCVSQASGAVVSIGKYQDESRALDPAACNRDGAIFSKRLTGGACIRAGEGIVALTLVLPEPSAFSDPIPPGKIINRYVRGVLTGIQLLGADAMYPGSDFITVEKRRGAYCTMDADDRGAAVFQVFLAVDCPYDIPRAWNGYPEKKRGGREHPEPTTMNTACGRKITRAEIIQAVAKGYKRRFGVESTVRPVNENDFTGPRESRGFAERRAWNDAAAREGRSSLHEYSLGFLHARVRLTGEGTIGDVLLQGDLIAAGAGVGAIENGLRGLRPNREDLLAKVQPLFLDPNYFFFGLRSSEILVDAVLEAARV